jgi:hypothetical protein
MSVLTPKADITNSQLMPAFKRLSDGPRDSLIRLSAPPVVRGVESANAAVEILREPVMRWLVFSKPAA